MILSETERNGTIVTDLTEERRRSTTAEVEEKGTVLEFKQLVTVT